MGPDSVAQRGAVREETEEVAIQLVSVTLDGGALQTFNLDVNRDWQPAKAKSP